MKSLFKRALRSLALLACLLALPAVARADVSLMVYDFNLGLAPAGNVDHVKSLGFKGIVTGVKAPADLARLQTYSNHVATIEGFDLLAFVTYDFNSPDSPHVWRNSLPILASSSAPLWVIVKNAPSALAVQDLLLEMATRSQSYGVQTVIYPHWHTDIETAAEAATLIAQVGHANLRNSLHTCHEIRSGNQYNMQATVAAHVSRSTLVTIAGALDKAYAGPLPAGGLPWDDAIRPLDEGSYSLLPFLQELRNAGYNGPVILHTFGVTNNPGHLQRSVRAYGQYRSQLQ